MRAGFGFIGLVVALVLVGILVNKQLSSQRAPVPSLQTSPGAAGPASAPPGPVRDQSQQIQQQIKQQMEGLMQQTRPVPGDEN